MLCPTTPAAGASDELVSNLGAIQTLVAGLQEGPNFCQSQSEEVVRAPQWVRIPKDVLIEAQCQAMR